MRGSASLRGDAYPLGSGPSVEHPLLGRPAQKLLSIAAAGHALSGQPRVFPPVRAASRWICRAARTEDGGLRLFVKRMMPNGVSIDCLF